jgi:hypothetical protein
VSGAAVVVVALGRRPGLARMRGCQIRRMPGTIDGGVEVWVLRAESGDVCVGSCVGAGC